MKKVILTVLVAGSLMATSCKQAKEAGNDVKEATEEVANDAANAAEAAADATKEAVNEAAAEVSDAVNSTVEGIKIPEFKDPKVGEYLESYAEYAEDYIEAKGDVVKNSELAKKSAELAAKGKEIVAGLDEEAKAKYNAVMNAIQAKMAPAK